MKLGIVLLEVVLNSKEELAIAMTNGGLLSIIGDVIVNEMDPYILVCNESHLFFFSEPFPIFIAYCPDVLYEYFAFLSGYIVMTSRECRL